MCTAVVYGSFLGITLQLLSQSYKLEICPLNSYIVIYSFRQLTNQAIASMEITLTQACVDKH